MSEDIKLEVSHEKHQKVVGRQKPNEGKLPDKQSQQKAPAVVPSLQNVAPTIKQPINNKQQEGKPPEKPAEATKKLQQSSSVPDNPLKVKQQTNLKGKNSIQPPNKAKPGIPQPQPPAPPPPKPTKQQQALHRIEYSKNSIAENLKLLLGHYKEIGEKEMKLHGHNPEKEAEIKQFLDGLNMQRKERKARLRKLQKQGTHRDREQREKSFQLEARVKERKLHVMKYLEESKLQRQENEQERAKEKQRWDKFYKEFKKIKPLYVVKEEQLNKALEDERKQLEEKISVIKMRNKPIDAQELEAHMERHRRILQELERQKAEEKQQWRKRIEQENSKLHEMWRGESHRYVMEEKRERKEHQKEPYEKLKRVREYRDVVRECYMPETSRRNSQGSLDNEDAKSEKPKRKKRYRYMNGVNYGEVYEPEHPQISEAEQKRMGNAYLNILRSLPKKRKGEESNNFEGGDRLKLIEQHAERYKLGNSYLHSAPLRRKNYSVDLPTNVSRREVNDIIGKLRHENIFFQQKEKLLKLDGLPVIAPQRQDRQREIDDKVIESIEKKMSLLEKLHAGPQQPHQAPQQPTSPTKMKRITLVTNSNSRGSDRSQQPT